MTPDRGLTITRSEFDAIVSTLTPKLRETLMQLALDDDAGVSQETYAALEALGFVEGFDFEGFDTVVRGVYRMRKYHMPSDVHIWCCAWMAEMYDKQANQ